MVLYYSSTRAKIDNVLDLNLQASAGVWAPSRVRL
jgi:hypothetical protein